MANVEAWGSVAAVTWSRRSPWARSG